MGRELGDSRSSSSIDARRERRNVIQVNGVAVVVPTRNDELSGIRIDHLLHSLLMQTTKAFRVLIRDEGKIGICTRREVQQFIDLLARGGIDVIYRRCVQPTGIARARKDLVDWASDDEYLCFVDDDMCLDPEALERLLETIQSHPDSGFVQGQKLEADPDRRYWNDINTLNGTSIRSDPFQIYFGDTALLMVRTSAFCAVDWEIVTRYSIEGLTGEDVAMSIMIADRYPCYAEPRAVGYHLSPSRTRWIWEAPSDLLQLELLRGRVRDETLKKALPHLAEFVTSAARKGGDS